MNKSIRLFEAISPSEVSIFRDFLLNSGYDRGDLIKSITNTLGSVVEEIKIGMIPTDSVTVLFDLARFLYEGTKGLDTYENDILAVLVKKSEDYNADKVNDPNFRIDGAREEYFPFGHWSYLQMIHTKINRIQTLEIKDGEAVHESSLDSVIDLGSYLIMYYSWLSELDPS